MSGKSPNNRTLTVSRDEYSSLDNYIVNTYEPNKIINGDLFDIIGDIPDKTFDLIIIDPPYNLSKDFGSNSFKKMSDKEYEEWLESWVPEVTKKMKDNGSLYMCGDWKCSCEMKRVLEKELMILNRITWQREKGRGSKTNWKNGMEDIWFAVKDLNNYKFNPDAVKMRRRVLAPYKQDGKPKDWNETESGNFRDTYASNFWDDISIPFWSMPENTDHPTQKPEKLIAKLMLASSDEGDMVFDPFLGSGTTAVVAEKLGRNWSGIEKNREYCYWSAKRLMKAESDKTIQGYSDGIFWERNTAIKKK